MWRRGQDLNLRPSGYERFVPACAAECRFPLRHKGSRRLAVPHRTDPYRPLLPDLAEDPADTAMQARTPNASGQAAGGGTASEFRPRCLGRDGRGRSSLRSSSSRTATSSSRDPSASSHMSQDTLPIAAGDDASGRRRRPSRVLVVPGLLVVRLRVHHLEGLVQMHVDLGAVVECEP